MSVKTQFLSAALLLAALTAAAQSGTPFAANAAGMIKKSDQAAIFRFLRGFHGLQEEKAASLARTTSEILDLVCRLPQLNPPMGFNVDAHVAAENIGLEEREPRINAACFLRYLENNPATGKTKQSLDGADIYFKINDFGFFSQMGNYWQDCDHAGFPLFFEEPVISGSADDYLEINREGTKVRFVCANARPLLIPLTRKEFIQFLIARKNYQIGEDQKTILDLHKTIEQSRATLAHPPSYLTEPVKKALSDGMATQGKQLVQYQEDIREKENKRLQYQDFLHSFSPADADAPVRMDYDKKSDELMGGIEQLLPAGSKEGVLLVRVNPDYYNYSPNAPAAQLITIYYLWPSMGNQNDLNYLQQATVSIFDHLDYHALRMAMQ